MFKSLSINLQEILFHVALEVVGAYYPLILSSLLTTQGAFVERVDQDQTAQNVHLISDLHCPHFHSRIYVNRFFILQWKYIFSQ